MSQLRDERDRRLPREWPAVAHKPPYDPTKVAGTEHVYESDVECASVDDRYLNARRGPTVPPGSHAESVPVIARFVMLDGSEEWRPAMQVRHVDGLILVRVGATTYQQEYTWLAEDDVTTAIRPRQGG